MSLARTLAAAVGAALIALPAAVAPAAVAPQPKPDITKLKYEPVGHFKGDQPIAAPATGCDDVMKPLRKGEIFNPSGSWNAYDNNVFEVICLPFRGPGDTTDDDPLGNKGAAMHGMCGGSDPALYGNLAQVAGACDNHQLEYIRYYEATMLEILGDFGATAHRYAFDVPDPGIMGNTRFGKGINPAIVIPGADNPEEQIVVGAHYDKTNDGPASFWDSQEGHGEMIRMAKLMADYWKATGTRPSATIKFIPWDAEESGTFGSLDYSLNNIVPGEESKVRGYFNTDPCAGGYPSFRYGNPVDRLRMGIQLADPAAIGGISAGDASRITAFNNRAAPLVEEVLDHIDDTQMTLSGPVETFLSTKEGSPDLGKLGGIALGTDRPILFSSDWRNFEVLGIPFFNPGPEVTGPNQESNGAPNFGIDQSADALTFFHTPNDNIASMSRFTGVDPLGANYSENYAKGMEFCAHMLSWGMLQPDQGGAQTVTTDPVAYYEALPNEAIEDQKLVFDAAGSYQYASAQNRTLVPDAQLEYSWDFGDGTTGKGRKVEHAYAQVGKYPSKLTVRNTKTGKTDVMAIGITVLPNKVAPPVLTKPAATDEDGTFNLSFDYTGGRAGQNAYSIEESTDAVTALAEDAEKLDRWTAGEAPGGTAPWQLSTSDTPKYFGAGPAGGASAFWTGVANGADQYNAGPTSGESVLTLKDTITVGKGGNVSLSYSSSFANDAGDTGIVEVAIDDGSTPQLEWIPVDTIKNGSGDEDSLSAAEQVQGDTSRPAYAARFVDLTRFGGRKLKMRFIYRLGAHDPTFPTARTGWYVDDVRILSGSYREIGTTADKQFTVSGRRKGTYGYRIKALFADGVKSSASNAENVAVTVGAPATAEGCAASAGFTRASVKVIGAGLGFDIAPVTGPATIDVFRASLRGTAKRTFRRVARFTGKTAGFRWNGRSAGKALPAGIYFVRLRAKNPDGRTTDTRSAVVERKGGRFVKRKAFQSKGSCQLLSKFRLSSPVFSGRAPLGISASTTQPATVTVSVFRGTAKKAVRTFKARTRTAKSVRFTLNAAKLPRGSYRVRVTATKGRTRVTRTLFAARL